MCGIAAIGIGITALGAIMSFQSQRAQAKGLEQSSEFNAAIDRNNATVADQQAKQAHQVGKVKAAQEGLKARRLIGLQTATAGGSGGAVSGESNQQIFSDTAGIGSINARNARSNAAREALGFTNQAAQFRAQAGLTLAEGSNRASAINSQATASLLTGASSVATKWNSYRKAA